MRLETPVLFVPVYPLPLRDREHPNVGHRLTRPERAGFLCRVVTNGKNKIKERRTRFGKLIPTLAPEFFSWQPRLLQ